MKNKNTFATNFKQNLKVARISRGLTQTELSKIAEISQKHVSDLERGNRKPMLETAAKLASVLDVTVDDLIRNN